MSHGIWSATSGAVAQERSLDTVANNVANATTTGYRADRVAFREFLSRAAADGPAPEDIRYTAVDEIVFDDQSGRLQQTGNPLDLALEGDGWFAVEAPEGVRFTRAGSFVIAPDGTLTTVDGLPVMGRPADPANPTPVRIRIPDSTGPLTVDADGTISGTLVDANGVQTGGAQRIGQFRLVRFGEGDGLRKEGHTRFVADGVPEEAYDTVAVRQGFLEGANVNAVAGMHELITASRSFEAFQKVIDSFREIDQRTAREVGSRS
ncbi:MAG: flagellar hook basal-body protein [Myxococcota bacterium]